MDRRPSIKDEIVHLRTYQATRAGDNLLHSAGCPQCSPEIGGLGAAAVELVRMVDIPLDRGIVLGCCLRMVREPSVF